MLNNQILKLLIGTNPIHLIPTHVFLLNGLA